MNSSADEDGTDWGPGLRIWAVLGSSNGRCVEFRGLGVYSSVEPVPVVPTSVLTDPSEPFRELPQQVHELLGDVPDGSFDLPLDGMLGFRL